MPLSVVALLFFLVAYRLYLIRPSSKQKRNQKVTLASTCSVAVFLGSGTALVMPWIYVFDFSKYLGGHTSEALALISSLDPKRYNRRTYIVTSGDTLSVQKALEFEIKLSEPHIPNVCQCTSMAFRAHDNGPFLSLLQCIILSIPRARNVHQSIMTTPFSSILALLLCTYHLTLRPLLYVRSPKFADVLILNGPGTCFLLCIAVYINKVSLLFVEYAKNFNSLLVPWVASTFHNLRGDICSSKISVSFREAHSSIGRSVSQIDFWISYLSGVCIKICDPMAKTRNATERARVRQLACLIFYDMDYAKECTQQITRKIEFRTSILLSYRLHQYCESFPCPTIFTRISAPLRTCTPSSASLAFARFPTSTAAFIFGRVESPFQSLAST